MKKYIILLCLFTLTSLLVIFLPDINNTYIKNSKLYISEVLSSNSEIKDNINGTSDYIELYNNYNYDINLEGYYLSDSEFNIKKWKFPNIAIKAKEYLIVYTSSLDTCDLNNRICHTNFNLSKNGEIITLSDSNGNIISKVQYPKLNVNTSYSYINKKYRKTDVPTPGKENINSTYNENKIEKHNLKITEYMTHNRNSHYDKCGNYYDWIEIYNYSNNNISNTSLYITDDKDNLSKYRLNNITIKSYSYIVVYFTKNKPNCEGLYVPFALSDNDNNIIISNGTDIIDKVNIVPLKDDISYGINNDKWEYFTTSTPGIDNNTASFAELGGSNGST